MKSLKVLLVATTAFLFSASPVPKAHADIVLTAATLGAYPFVFVESPESLRLQGYPEEAIAQVMSEPILMSTGCFKRARIEPVLYFFCPLAFVFNEQGKIVMSADSRTALLEQGFSEADIAAVEAKDAAAISAARVGVARK